MSQIITVPLTEPFLSRVADYAYDIYKRGQDLSRLAIVFGGRRPALFLKRELARRIEGAFVSPSFFTIDEWMAYMACGKKSVAKSQPLDHGYAIYKIAKEKAPDILKNRESFAQFLPWAKEILNFIEQLDLEDVPLDALKLIEEHAHIGFSVPEDINRLLTHLCVIRKAYHQFLEDEKLTTRGYQYLQAARRVSEVGAYGHTPLPYDEILFCNFFYLHRTENTVIKNIYDRWPTVLFMQGDQRRWPVLERIAKTFGTSVVEGKEVIPTTFNLKIYEAFNSHAQAGLVKEILSDLRNTRCCAGAPEDWQDTVVVLPNADLLLPLLTAVGGELKEFNISMGYPLKRSALYALLEKVVQAQRSHQDNLYYARDYLKLLQHPLVKNLNLLGDPALIRMLVHRLEEALKGDTLTMISGSLFLDPEEIFKDKLFWESGMTSEAQALRTIHRIFFTNFQDIHCLADLASALQEFLNFMQAHSPMERFALNNPIARRLQSVCAEFAACAFGRETFQAHDLFRMLQESLSSQMLAFSGSPLRELQMLGLLETRSLNFKNVIVMDVNEGVLPALNITEPLIPREVMIKLNLDRLELEEEIQRFWFMRLIASAQNVHLIYQHSDDKVRSRFVEELIWEQERRQQAVGVVDILHPCFEISFQHKQKFVPKSQAVMEFLQQGFTFSASSLNTYLRNPYEFYCQYILGLKQKDDLLEDPQSRHVGTFIHNLFEEAFKGFIGKKPVIDGVFEKFFYKIYETEFAKNFARAKRSDTFLVETILRTRLDYFLKAEAKRCQQVEKILYIERKFEQVVTLANRPVRFSYRMDRVDQMQDGTILILDYKTGSLEPMPASAQILEHLELNRVNIRDHIHSFQMPLYVQYLCGQYPGGRVDAALYQLRTMNLNYFLRSYPRENIDQILSVYHRALEAVMAEIFNPEVPFIDDPAG